MSDSHTDYDWKWLYKAVRWTLDRNTIQKNQESRRPKSLRLHRAEDDGRSSARLLPSSLQSE